MRKDVESALHYERLGENFYFGYTVKKDLDQAKEYFCLAALYGEGEVKAEALCNLALLTDDPYAKLALYMQAAEENCADAINMTGVCLERIFPNPFGISKKVPEEPLEWYREAASAGSTAGMYNYALWEKNRKIKCRYLRRASECGHRPSAALLEELMAEEAEERARERERLSPYLEAAQEWAGKPVAILSVSTAGVLTNNKNQLAYDIAAVLQQSVILLFSGGKDSRLSCVGYDFGMVGLAEAMNNEYVIQRGWGFGKYMIVSILKDDQSLYCAAVQEALEKPET